MAEQLSASPNDGEARLMKNWRLETPLTKKPRRLSRCERLVDDGALERLLLLLLLLSTYAQEPTSKICYLRVACGNSLPRLSFFLLLLFLLLYA